MSLISPTNVVATPDTNSVDLTWDLVSGATSYNILYGTTTSYGNTKTFSTNSGTITGLTSGVIYNFAIQAVNESTISSNSYNVTSIPNISIPILEVYSATNNSVDLFWSDSLGATSYNIFYGTTASYGTTINNVTSTSSNVTGLTNGTLYYFTVQAVNSIETSGNSNQITAVTIPSAPTGLQVTSETSSSVSLSWAASPGATSYNILYGYGDIPNYETTLTYISNPPHTVSGLIPGTTYYFYSVR